MKLGKFLFYTLIFLIAHYFYLHRFFAISQIPSIIFKTLESILTPILNLILNRYPHLQQHLNVSSKIASWMFRTLEIVWSIFKVILVLIITVAPILLFSYFIYSAYQRNVLRRKDMNMLEYAVFFVVVLGLPTLISYLLLKHEIFLYLCLPLYLSLFLRMGASDFFGNWSVNRCIRNFVLFQALILIVF